MTTRVVRPSPPTCSAGPPTRFDVVALPVDREQLEPMVLRRYHPSSVRWVMFQRFLDVEGSNYERVLMVDAGQAFFQENPFDIIGDPGKKPTRF